jgi:hypothetical protein
MCFLSSKPDRISDCPTDAGDFAWTTFESIGWLFEAACGSATNEGGSVIETGI